MRRSGGRTAALRALVVAALAAPVLAACGGDPASVCGECGPTLVAADGDGVVVAQGRMVSRLSRAGATVWRAAVLPTRRGTDVQAVAVTRDGVAWLGAGPLVIRAGRDGVASRSRRAPAAHVTGMATDGAVVWMSAGRRVMRLTADGAVAARSERLPAPAQAVVVEPRAVWTRAPRPVALARGDLAPAAAPGAAPAGIGPAEGEGFSARGAGALWTLTREGVLRRRDPASRVPTAPPLDLGERATALATGPRAVWVGLREGGVVRIDPGGPSVAWTRRVPIT